MFETFLWRFFSEEHQTEITSFMRKEKEEVKFDLAVHDRQTNENYCFHYHTNWKTGTEYVRRFLFGNGWRKFCSDRNLETNNCIEFSTLPEYTLGVRVYSLEEYEAAKTLMEISLSMEKMIPKGGTIYQHCVNSTEQERTIDGLRQGLDSDNFTNKLQMEQLRLTRAAQDLSRQLEACTAEASSLQSKIIHLIEHLKSVGKVGASLALKLEHELTYYVQCLQSTSLSLLNGCIRMCENLHGVLERKTASEGSMESLARALRSHDVLKREIHNAAELRLAGVEQDLRRQLETCTAETSSLWSENLFERLKSTRIVGGFSAVKLEHELTFYVQCLQSTSLSLLNQCIQTCANLHGVLKRKSASEGSVESFSLVQHGMKVQEFRKGLEQLTRSLGKTASVLEEKSDIASSEPELPDASNSEDDLKSELKAEQLLTTIQEEKMYCKEKELEQMQVELARALRSHDVLKREIQDTVYTVSCVYDKMKYLELQVIQKDGTIKELTSIRGVLSKVSQEKDLMWQEVKGYLLLNHEIESH